MRIKMAKNLDELIQEITKDNNRVGKVIEMITAYGGIDGEHHKQWLLDEIVRTLLGPKRYKEWRKSYDNYRDKNGEEYGKWDEGIAP